MEKDFEFLEHTADIKFRASGKTLNKAFENSLKAVSSILSRENKIEEKIEKKIKLSGRDNEALLFNLVEELLFLMDTEDFIISSGKLEIDKTNLKGILRGDSVKNYSDLDQIKAPTYHQMKIEKIGTNWQIEMVVDV